MEATPREETSLSCRLPRSKGRERLKKSAFSKKKDSKFLKFERFFFFFHFYCVFNLKRVLLVVGHVRDSIYPAAARPPMQIRPTSTAFSIFSNFKRFAPFRKNIALVCCNQSQNLWPVQEMNKKSFKQKISVITKRGLKRACCLQDCT